VNEIKLSQGDAVRIGCLLSLKVCHRAVAPCKGSVRRW